jgi:hypothetical protein
MQIWIAKYAGFVSNIILNFKIPCADIVYENNGNFKEANLIRHREIKITCTKDYRYIEIVTVVNTNVTALCV